MRVVKGTKMFKGMLDRGNAGISMTAKEFNKFEKLSGVNLDKEAENIQAEQEANLSRHSNAHEIDVDFKTALLTEPLQKLIDLGEQPGMTLPKFLTIQIEKGLDKAAQGTVTSLEGIKHTLGYANAQMLSRIDLEENEAKLTLFQKMIDEAPFNVPNTKKYNLLRRKIEHEFAPQHEQWKAIKSRWEDIIDAIELWLIASTNVYQSYAPWLFMTDFNEKKKLAEYIMDCNPGFIKIKLENFKAYFDMSFEDIFKHETFVWEVENYHLDYSQEYLTFLIGPVFDECKPLAKASSSITSHFENHFHKQNRMGNPEAVKAYNRIVDFYDDRYGKGRFEERHGASDFPVRNTANWDLSTFELFNK